MEWCKVRVVSSKELNDQTINLEEVKGRGDKIGTGNFTDKIQTKTSISNDESRTNCTGTSLSAFPCYRFLAVLTRERASPVSPQADLNMLVYRDRVRHTRVNLRTSSSSGVVDFQLQGNLNSGSTSRGSSRDAITLPGTQTRLQPPDITSRTCCTSRRFWQILRRLILQPPLCSGVRHERWNLRHHFCPLMGYLASDKIASKSSPS